MFFKLSTLALAMLISTATAQTLDFRDGIDFYFPWYDRDAPYKAFVYERTLDETTLLTFSSTNGARFIVWDESKTNDICWNAKECLLEPGTYYISIDETHNRIPATTIAIDKAQPFDFERINLNQPFSRPLVFNNETPTIMGFIPVHLYSFEITQPSILKLEANRDVHFGICDNAYLFGCQDLSDLTLRNYSTVLSPGTYYLAVANIYMLGSSFSTTVKIERSSLQEESFSIKNMEALPFSSNLFFHPSYNSRKKGNVIEKAFKLVLNDETMIYYADGNSNLSICTDKELASCAGSYWHGDIFALREGTYYLVFNDNGYYNSKGEYLDVFVRLEDFDFYDFTQIAIPFKDAFSFDSETPIVQGNRAFLHEFTLQEDALLKFNADDDVKFSVYREADIYLKEPILNYGYFSAGKYYLKIGAAKVGNYTVNIEINKIAPEQFSIVDMLLPFDEDIYFNPASNYRINNDGNMEKVFKLDLSENTLINLGQNNPPLCIYASEDLNSIIDCYDYFYHKDLALSAGIHYLAFNDNGYSKRNIGYYLHSDASLSAFEGDFTEITEFPSNRQLVFDNKVPALWNHRTYLYKLKLAEASHLYFNSDKVGNINFHLYEDPLLQNQITQSELEAGTYYLRVTGNYGNYNANIVISDTEVATGIAGSFISNGNIRAYALGNSIMLSNLPKNTKVEVYSLSGKLISSKSFNQANQSSDISVEVQAKGVYIVKAGNKTLRIPVR